MDPELPVGPERVPPPVPRPGAPGVPSPPARLASLFAWASIDLAPRHRQPRLVLVLVATAVALAASVGLDELVVHVTRSLFPATAHFSHFRFSDYASLTVVGVLAACCAWPVVTRISSAPRRLFFRAAVAATVMLWLPDVWLLVRGELAAGVAALMVMHLVIAIVTYNALVRIAPVSPAPGRSGADSVAVLAMPERSVRQLWNAMAVLVALELVLGIAAIVTVPFRRPNAILPARATWLYAAHGGVGIVLAVGAAGALALAPLAGRMARIGAVLGALGVFIGLAGGVLATFQITRLLGMGLMMIGVVTAGIGYLAPALDAMGKAEAARAQAARQAMAQANAAQAAQAAQGEAPNADPTPDAHPSANGRPGYDAPVD